MDKITNIYKFNYYEILNNAIKNQGYDDLEDMLTSKKLTCNFCNSKFKDLGNHIELSDDFIICEDCHSDNDILINIIDNLKIENKELKKEIFAKNYEIQNFWKRDEKLFKEKRKNLKNDDFLEDMI